jgi:hypothetical protein
MSVRFNSSDKNPNSSNPLGQDPESLQPSRTEGVHPTLPKPRVGRPSSGSTQPDDHSKQNQALFINEMNSKTDWILHISSYCVKVRRMTLKVHASVYFNILAWYNNIITRSSSFSHLLDFFFEFSFFSIMSFTSQVTLFKSQSRNFDVETRLQALTKEKLTVVSMIQKFREC